MQRIARFERVSEAQFAQDAAAFALGASYAAVKLPRRATAGSAGYDFCAPMDFTLAPGEEITVPTGIRAWMQPGWVLVCCPRSGLGFKFRLQLNNTVGIIDSDYYAAKNEGHILLRITNDSKQQKTLSVAAGEAFCQGIFLPFGVTEDDDAAAAREGGFGSTGK